MITVICGTNRPKNFTQKVVDYYVNMLMDKGEQVRMVELERLPIDYVFNNNVYGEENVEFSRIVEENILPSNRLIIITPEYNGSFPGVLKAFIDGIKPSDWKGKKAALVGISSGRAGNARGMDQLTNILNYLNIAVLPMKVAISHIEGMLDKEKENLVDPKTIQFIDKQAQTFLEF